jgi:hypothetical protein
MDNVLQTYLDNASDYLEALSKLASTSLHGGDIGSNREGLLIEFINKHCPDRLSAFRGGKILGYKQEPSAQVDIIVRSDISPKFSLNETEFTFVEGTMLAIEVKSNLNKDSLYDALGNLSIIPQPSEKVFECAALGLPETWIDEFKSRIPSLNIFAYDSISLESLYEHLITYYRERPEIPWNRRPSQILVNKKFCIKSSSRGVPLSNGERIPPNEFYPFYVKENRGYCLGALLDTLTASVTWLPQMRLNFFEYINEGYTANKGAQPGQGTAVFASLSSRKPAG